MNSSLTCSRVPGFGQSANDGHPKGFGRRRGKAVSQRTLRARGHERGAVRIMPARSYPLLLSASLSETELHASDATLTVSWLAHTHDTSTEMVNER